MHAFNNPYGGFCEFILHYCSYSNRANLKAPKTLMEILQASHCGREWPHVTEDTFSMAHMAKKVGKHEQAFKDREKDHGDLSNHRKDAKGPF